MEVSNEKALYRIFFRPLLKLVALVDKNSKIFCFGCAKLTTPKF